MVAIPGRLQEFAAGSPPRNSLEETANTGHIGLVSGGNPAKVVRDNPTVEGNDFWGCCQLTLFRCSGPWADRFFSVEPGCHPMLQAVGRERNE